MLVLQRVGTTADVGAAGGHSTLAASGAPFLSLSLSLSLSPAHAPSFHLLSILHLTPLSVTQTLSSSPVSAVMWTEGESGRTRSLRHRSEASSPCCRGGGPRSRTWSTRRRRRRSTPSSRGGKPWLCSAPLRQIRCGARCIEGCRCASRHRHLRCSLRVSRAPWEHAPTS